MSTIFATCGFTADIKIAPLHRNFESFNSACTNATKPNFPPESELGGISRGGPDFHVFIFLLIQMSENVSGNHLLILKHCPPHFLASLSKGVKKGNLLNS